MNTAILSLFTVILGQLGHEVNTAELANIIFKAELGSFGNQTAVLQAIIEDQVNIFPDSLSRPYLVMLVNALAGAVAAKPA